MSFRHVKSILLACSGAAALLAATAAANAGGLALREQSSYGQGSSFAGVAAGGSLSSMYWNPATMTQAPGMQFETVGTAILPSAINNVGAGSTLAALGGTNNIALSAFVPSFYASWQINPQMWVGLSFNAPFGLSESFPSVWAGRDFAANSSSLSTYNATPTFAYKINDWISVGVGVQIQYAKATLGKGITLGGPTFVNSTLAGNGWAYGYTAGVTLTPTANTTIGIGYRSQLNQKIDGSLTLDSVLAAASTGDAHTTVNLPGMLSVGLRQKLADRWTLLGTFEWTNWKRIGTSAITNSAGAPVLVGGAPVTAAFNYSDGWFYSVGAEYEWSKQLTLRSGVAFEKSPVTDAVRTPLVPDNDRIWVSIGSTWKFTNKLSADLAYSHVFVKNTSIADVAATGTVYNGTVDSRVDIISASLKYRWDDPVEPVKQRYAK